MKNCAIVLDWRNESWVAEDGGGAEKEKESCCVQRAASCAERSKEMW